MLQIAPVPKQQIARMVHQEPHAPRSLQATHHDNQMAVQLSVAKSQISLLVKAASQERLRKRRSRLMLQEQRRAQEQESKTSMLHALRAKAVDAQVSEAVSRQTSILEERRVKARVIMEQSVRQEEALSRLVPQATAWMPINLHGAPSGVRAPLRGFSTQTLSSSLGGQPWGNEALLQDGGWMGVGGLQEGAAHQFPQLGRTRETRQWGNSADAQDTERQLVEQSYRQAMRHQQEEALIQQQQETPQPLDTLKQSQVAARGNGNSLHNDKEAVSPSSPVVQELWNRFTPKNTPKKTAYHNSQGKHSFSYPQMLSDRESTSHPRMLSDELTVHPFASEIESDTQQASSKHPVVPNAKKMTHAVPEAEQTAHAVQEAKQATPTAVKHAARVSVHPLRSSVPPKTKKATHRVSKKNVFTAKPAEINTSEDNTDIITRALAHAKPEDDEELEELEELLETAGEGDDDDSSSGSYFIHHDVLDR
jgi:hypothetical protein